MNSDFTAFFLSTPKSTNVSEFKPLRQFINSYPYEQLRPQMRKLQKDFPSYRAIKGDGNCFYRACIFLYLSLVDLTHFTTVFPPATIFDCLGLPFCNEDNYSSEQLLRYIWTRFLQPLQNKLTHEREKKLTTIFNSSEMFDAIMVAYFRSLNHAYLQLHRAKFAAYTNGGIENQLRKVLTYGKQSQGVEIYSLAELLQAKITIVMTHEVTVKAVEYLQGGMYSFRLFYRPGHYDILSDPRQKTVKMKADMVRQQGKAPSLIFPSAVTSAIKQSQNKRFYTSQHIYSDRNETVESQRSIKSQVNVKEDRKREPKAAESLNNSHDIVIKISKPIIKAGSLVKQTSPSTPQQTKDEPSIHLTTEPTMQTSQNIRMFIEGSIVMLFFLTIIIGRLSL